MDLPGILTNTGGTNDAKIVNAASAGGAIIAIKKSRLLIRGEDNSLLPAIEKQKNTIDNKIFRMVKFKNSKPNLYNNSIYTRPFKT